MNSQPKPLCEGLEEDFVIGERLGGKQRHKSPAIEQLAGLAVNYCEHCPV